LILLGFDSIIYQIMWYFE